MFHTDHIRYYLHHIEEKQPDLLQEIVDKGEIYKHLDELDTKVTDAVNRQTELLMQSSRDYQAAVMSGRIDQSGAIGNLLRMQTQSFATNYGAARSPMILPHRRTENIQS